MNGLNNYYINHDSMCFIPKKTSTLTVMIADDSAFMRQNLKEILTRAGFDVMGEAEDGMMAVEMYEKLRTDIVTLDITMPYFSGIEALKAIKDINPNAIAVICSAMGQEYYINEAFECGADGYIVKPFKTAMVLQAFRNVIEICMKEKS